MNPHLNRRSLDRYSPIFRWLNDASPRIAFALRRMMMSFMCMCAIGVYWILCFVTFSAGAMR